MSTLKVRKNLLKAVPKKQFFNKPFITIARQPGSGGSPIAQKVAEKLNFAMKDKTIVDELMKSTKKRRAVIKNIDEKGRTQTKDIIHSVLNPEYVSGNTFIKELTKIILAYAHEGNCVILGRGANFMTSSAQGLHVNVVAPYDVRVDRAMEYENFDKKTAKKVIAHVQKERKEFAQTYFRKDIKRNSDYDLTLNTHHYDIDEAADIIIKAFYCKFPASKRIKSTLF